MNTEQEVVGGQASENVTPQEEVKQDPYEAKALEMGWRPQEEWDGSPEDFVDAKEFVRRQPLFDKIAFQHKELKQLQQAFEAFKIHHSRVKESEYNRALETLKKAKRDALAAGETDQALAIEDRMEEIQEQKANFDREAQSQPPVQAQAINPAFTDWLKENSWYQKDIAMTSFADRIGVDLHKKGYTNDEILKMVANEVKKEFKHKFVNTNRERAGAVESGSRKTSSKNAADDTAGMSEDDVRMMNKIIRAGGISKEEYLKEYRRVQGL